MKITHYAFILSIVAAVFFVEYDLSRREDLEKVARLNVGQEVLLANKVTTDSSQSITPAQIIPQKSPKVFMSRFKEESEQIAKIQNDPELVQNRMKALAEAMTPQDVEGLYDLISDEKKDGDQRALAVELLSIKNDTTSLIALQNFVANNTTVNGTQWDRKKELETILRAQAVESIADYPQKDIALSTLNYLQRKVDERFLIDRIGRAAANLNNKAPSIQQQDEAALKQLIE